MRTVKSLLKTSFITLAVSTILIYGMQSATAQSLNIKYNVDENKATVSGVADNGVKYAALEILKKDKDEDDVLYADEENLGTVIIHADQVKVNDDKSFEFLFTLPPESETYDYVARVSYGHVKNGILMYVSHSDFKAAMEAINSSLVDTADKMYGAIENSKKYLGIDVLSFDKLTKTEKLNISQKVLDERNFKNGGNFEDSENFSDAFNPYFVIEMVNHAGGDDKDFDVITVIWNNQEYFEFSSLSAYKTYEKQKDDVKKLIINGVCERDDYKTIEEIQDEFSFLTVNYALYKADGYDVVEEVLEQNKKFLGISMSDYNDLSSKSSVNKKMTGRRFSSVSDIKETFEKLVIDAGKKGSSGGSGGSGGGSGSSGKGSGNANLILGDTVPKVNKEVFYDLDGVQWAKESILGLYDKGVVSGKSDGTFAPYDFITREEFAKMLTLVLGCADNNAVCHFSDVLPGAWYYSYVASGVNAGLIKGVSEENFGTGEHISRQDIAVLINRGAIFAGITFGNTKLTDFSDFKDVSDYAKEAVSAISGAGLVNGTDEGNFEPKRGATRAETAKILYGFLKLIG